MPAAARMYCRFAPPQGRHTRDLEYGLEALVALDQRVDGVFEVGLGFEVDGHGGLNSSCTGLTAYRISYSVIPGRCEAPSRNLEIPGSVLRTAPE